MTLGSPRSPQALNPSKPTSAVPDASATGGVRVAPVHDFVRKLRQRGLRETVVAYVDWQRTRRAAVAAETTLPEPFDRAPLSINLDLTTACNYACDHCIDFEILNSGINHNDAELRKSLAGMAARGLRSVILIGGGEPTVYPRFREMVRFIKSLDLQVAIVSNGSRNDRILDIMDCLGAEDWIRLSLDSGTDATFQAMHKPKKPITLQAICEGIAPLRERNPLPRLGFSYIITWDGAHRTPDVPIIENVHEMAAAARLARDYGFDYISFKPFLIRTAEGAEVMDPAAARAEVKDVVARIQAQVRDARAIETDAFAVVESTNLKVLEQGTWQAWTQQPRTCHMQALRQVLSPEGLWNCPAHRGVPAARIDGRDAFGDDEKAERAAGATAEILDRFDASVRCREVTCLYHDVNWWLEKAIDDPSLMDAASEVAGADAFL